MPSAQTFPLSPELKTDLRELQRRQIATISLGLMAISGAGCWWQLPTLRDTWGVMLAFVTLLATAIAMYVIRTKHLKQAQVLLVLGPAFSFALGWHWRPDPLVPFFAAPAVIVAAAVNPMLGLVAAVVDTATLLVFGIPTQTLYIAIGLLWFTAGIEWVSSRSFYTAVAWSEHSQRRASTLLQELRAHQGELNKTLAALTEATRRLQRVNQELALARQQAEEARALKEQFVANVSHELRTPLNLVMGFAEMMYLAPESYKGVVWTPDLESDLGELYRASRHLQNLVNDVLDLSRIDAARLPMFREFQDVRPVITEAIETIMPLLRQRGLECRVEWPDTLPQLFIDRTRIRQVMLNLLNNASRFTSAGRITVRAALRENRVVVEVQDTGVGIPATQLNTLFERFRQAEAGARSGEGAGLGLALSRQFIELHGGRMWAESEVGVGSTFSFSLPLPGTTPESIPLRQTPGVHRTEPTDAPLIVVDPDPSIAEMLSRYLGERPILAACDTQEAEALIESEHPRGVIINQPPEAPLSSWLATPGVASERYRVPIVRCSIPSPSWLMQSAGLDDCLTKPISREALSRVVAQYGDPSRAILIVDDNPGFVSLLSRMLSLMEWTGSILSAYSGSEALRLAREAAPGLVLLDLLMPEIDGFEVLARLRQEAVLPDLRVVAITATSYAEETLRRHGGYFTLTQAGGMATSTLIELLNAVFQGVEPTYVLESALSST